MPKALALNEDLFGPVISSYSRKQAIDDGLLIDVSKVAREAGITFPVALTAAVWEDCVAWSDKDSQRQTHQDEAGRLWDVVFMTRYAIQAAKSDGDRLDVVLHRVPRGGRHMRPQLVTLKALCGPGDQAEPVITIMQLNED